MARRPALECHEVTPDRWDDFARLFESRGGPSYCWCMIFRVDAQEARDSSRPGRKAAMQRRVDAGTPVGILGYLDGEPVAWCSIAPKDTFLRLGKVESTGGGLPSDERVWSLTCFFVTRALRGRGFTRALLDAAVAQARARGARAVEAYPVDPESPSYRFGGFVEMFRRAGFRPVGHLGSRRHVMRRALRARLSGRRSNPLATGELKH